MKKLIKLFTILIAILILGTKVEIFADEIKTSDIANSTYIIGNYMLTREGSDSYNGILTTQVIMLAAKSIKENNIDYMLIYYKNARGKWIDALTGESISVPETVNIEYVNLLPNELLGDINKDGKFGNKDITTLEKYLNQYTLSSEILSTIGILGDVNQDSLVNDDDLALLYYANVNDKTFPITNYKTYSITYDLDGGGVSKGNREYIIEYDGRSQLLNNPTKEGYGFIGWTGSNGDTPQLEVYLPSYPKENLSYKANWAMIGDVNYDNLVNIKDLSFVQKYIYLNNNINSHQTLEFTNEILSTIEILGDVNIDGKLNNDDIELITYYIGNRDTVTLPITDYKTYSITYDLDGGDVDSNKLNRNYIIEYAGRMGKEKLLNNPTKEGYGFIGWTGSNGDTPQLEVYLPAYPKENLSYKANWELIGDIDKNGSVNLADVTYLRRYLSEKYIIPDEILSTLGVLGDVNQDGLLSDDDVVLIRYAHQNSLALPITDYKTYSITYDLDGGEYTNKYEENKNYIIEHDGRKDYYKLNNPVKEGYTFIGWTGSNGDTPQLEVYLPNYPTENLSYKANWLKNYKITIAKADGYSPDVTLQVFNDNNESVTVNRIEYTDGHTLCESSNMTVSSSDIENETILVVVLADETKVMATIQSE